MRIREVTALSVSTKMTATDCATCGVIFGITEEYEAERRKDGKTFYCPNGHSLVYGPGKTARERELELLAERLKKSVALSDAMLHEERGRRKVAERQAAAQKGITTKLKKRIANGVCPVCSRSFENLHRHMHDQHPDYAVEQSHE